MFGWLLLTVGAVGFGWAAYSDLKTTEFHDGIPYGIIALALLIRGVAAVLTNDVSMLLNALMYGSLFLGFGLLMYRLNQWGDGDAWLLGALGFLFPDSAGFAFSSALPFPVAMLFNFLFVSFAYLVVYSIGLGVASGSGNAFFHQLRGEMRSIAGATLAFSAAVFALTAYALTQPSIAMDMALLLPIAASPFLLLAVLVFVKYGRFIETKIFRKRIHVSKLRVGDVPVNNRWRVLTKTELRTLKARGGYIWIKEGVRFAPVFFLTMLVTLFYGVLLFA